MRTLDLKMTHQRATMHSLLLEIERIRRAAAAPVADAVVAEHTEIVGEGWFFQERSEPVDADAVMHEHDGFFSGTPHLILQFNAPEGCSIQARLFHDVPPFGSGVWALPFLGLHREKRVNASSLSPCPSLSLLAFHKSNASLLTDL